MKLYAEVDDKDRKLKTLYGIVEYMDGTRLVCDKFYAVKEQELCSDAIICSDAISRQAVNILVDELARAISDERCCMSRGRSTASIMQDILDLPPVTPQSKTGHWKLVQRGKSIDICCSSCEKVRIKQYAYNYTIDQLDKEDLEECFECADMRYCPNCGVKMESEG